MKKLMLTLLAVLMIGAVSLTSVALAGPGCDGYDKSSKVTDTDAPKKPASEG